MRWFAIFAAILVTSACGDVYTLDYVVRVIRHQDADSDDFRWKPAITLPASDAPRPMPRDTSADTAVAAALEGLLEGQSIEQFMAGTDTQALMIARDDRVVLERYARGVDASTPQPTFSVSKSILSLIVGRALDDGVVGIDDPVTQYVPELRERDARFDGISLANLIDMRAGLAFADEVNFPFVTADKALVYYATDLRAVTLTQTRVQSEPGPFHYNDYNPNLLALTLERAAGAYQLSEMRAQLWNDLGAEDAALWSADDRGFAYWESGFVASTRDLMKIGQLMLDEDGSQLLPAAWRARITDYTPTQPIETYDGRQWAYRGGWWLILRPDGRHDIAAIGRFSQLIYVSPANGVVIVRTGRHENAPSDGDTVRLFYALVNELGASATRAGAIEAPS